MASIFKNSVIERKVKALEVPDFENKIEIARKWHNDYHKGTLKGDKETSREQAYNQDFFIKILNYEEKPSLPYSLEPKATTEKGQLPDLVLGYFDKEVSNLASVIELKGASIPLDRPQKREGNMSPIQQAFKYKTQYSQCPFVMASNFFEFRLFQDNQLDYEIWTLDDLVNPENDYFNLKKFYFLLNKENFTTKEGKTSTEELLSDIRIEEEKISKKFYKEYKELRTDLLRSIYSKNEVVKKDINLGIEKAQKIIDRIVFVCFCEDKGLLPENTLQRVLKMTDNSFGSLWGGLKAFFDAIDNGSEKLEIPNGYNGGLFKTDNDLDNLKIDDNVLRKLANLGTYNFQEDLSVNILGHIFEQSISDLEEIKIKVEESQGVEDVADVGKRKKDGIFYTPDYIVDYIVKNSLGKYLENKENDLKEKHKLKGDILDENYQKREEAVYGEYREFLQKLKILDPACGSGAFLVKVFDYLMEENKRVGHILGDLFSNEDVYRTILQKNIYGVDLNSESVEITKLSLWLKTAEKSKKLTALDENIKCGNSLVSDKKVAGEKAFDWNKEFSGIMKSGGFDVIIGNPPYVKEYTSRNAFDGLRESPYYQGKMDLWYFFGSIGLDLLKDGGLVSYIAPNNWVTNAGASKFRDKVLEDGKILNYADFGDYKVFSEAGIQTMIYVMQKTTGNIKYDTDYSKILDKNVTELEVISFLQKMPGVKFEYLKVEIDKEKMMNNNITFLDGRTEDFLSKIEKNRNFTLEDKEVAQGIVGAPDKAFLLSEEKIDGFEEKERVYIKMFHTSVERFHTNKTSKFIIYLSGDNFHKDIENLPNIKAHFDPYKSELIEAKIRYKTPNKKYYFLHRERDERFFVEGDKIVCATRTKRPACTFINEPFYGSRALNFIKTERINLKFLTSILNSSLADFWLRNKGKLTGELLQIDKSQLLSIPIKLPDNIEPFKELVDNIIEAKQKIFDYTLLLQKINEDDNFDREIKLKKDIEKLESEVRMNEAKINELVMNLYELTDEEKEIIRNS